jgi:hypothetical protein
MHCEQNFAKPFVKTIIGEKIRLKVQLDLQRKGIKPHFWLIINP